MYIIYNNIPIHMYIMYIYIYKYIHIHNLRIYGYSHVNKFVCGRNCIYEKKLAQN